VHPASRSMLWQPLAALHSGSGAPVAPAGNRLRLLPSGPDLVHEPTPHGTRAIDASRRRGDQGRTPLRGVQPRYSGLRVQGTATSPPSTVQVDRSARIPRSVVCPAVNTLSNLPNFKRSLTLALTALMAAGAIAGCGSSKNSNEIAPGNENAKAAAEAAKLEASESKTSTSTTAGGAVQTPTSGPLSKEPTVKPPSGPAPTKLVIKELIPGKGAVAKAGDSVTVNYVGVLYKTGKQFDASWNRHTTFTTALSNGQVIPGWVQGIAGMKVGGRRELIIPPALGYGASGQGSTIPPNSTLVFVVDLLSVQ
jgi:peptidylprolyl isomerase